MCVYVCMNYMCMNAGPVESRSVGFPLTLLWSQNDKHLSATQCGGCWELNWEHLKLQYVFLFNGLSPNNNFNVRNTVSNNLFSL